MYRFLLSRRWLGLAALMTLAAAVMVALGFWQLDRYHLRSAVNARIDAAGAAEPRPIGEVVPAPTDRAGAAPPEELSWTRVTVTGRFDPAHEVLARSRTVNGRVGFEVVTPLVLGDGTAVLVDRGWVPPAGGATTVPDYPPPPGGEVTVVGRVHQPESRAGAAERANGGLQVRRISPQALAGDLPYRVYGAYLIAETPTDPAFTTIGPDRQNSWLNAGYTVQWWLFAGLTLFGYYYLARREARADAPAVDRLSPV